MERIVVKGRTYKRPVIFVLTDCQPQKTASVMSHYEMNNYQKIMVGQFLQAVRRTYGEGDVAVFSTGLLYEPEPLHQAYASYAFLFPTAEGAVLNWEGEGFDRKLLSEVTPNFPVLYLLQYEQSHQQRREPWDIIKEQFMMYQGAFAIDMVCVDATPTPFPSDHLWSWVRKQAEANEGWDADVTDIIRWKPEDGYDLSALPPKLGGVTPAIFDDPENLASMFVRVLQETAPKKPRSLDKIARAAKARRHRAKAIKNQEEAASKAANEPQGQQPVPTAQSPQEENPTAKPSRKRSRSKKPAPQPTNQEGQPAVAPAPGKPEQEQQPADGNLQNKD